MKTACALLSTFNEADIVLETVKKLIDGGVEVFVIDNASTDHTIEILNPFVGKGVFDIRTVKFFEDEREIYDWTSILKMKEALSRELGFDWYLHVDADEIRYSPWPHLSLREGLDRVDRSGYNLVNFKLFNFRLTEDLSQSDDYERDMPAYSAGEHFNQYQIKAWKAHPQIDIASYGGHVARIPDGKIYPIRFVHKHYPVRSLAHGRRKIVQERINRFSSVEKQRGWHVQYDSLRDVMESDILWNSDKLTIFDIQRECLDLLGEGVDVASNILSTLDHFDMDRQIEQDLVRRFVRPGFTQEHVVALLGVTRHLVDMIDKGSVPAIESAQADLECMRSAVKLLAARKWLSGDASIFQRVSMIRFQEPPSV